MELHVHQNFTFCLFQVSASGNVLRSEIVGAIKMRVYLSGMPELRLGLNDKILFESTGRKYKIQWYFLSCHKMLSPMFYFESTLNRSGQIATCNVSITCTYSCASNLILNLATVQYHVAIPV